MASESDPAVLRIGELARRVAVNQDLLRAWERRYGLLKPVRSPGGYRLYSGADEQRVRRCRPISAAGWPPPKPLAPPSMKRSATPSQRRR